MVDSRYSACVTHSVAARGVEASIGDPPGDGRQRSALQNYRDDACGQTACVAARIRAEGGMARPRRFSDEQLFAALDLWGGNVKAAAEHLGLRRDNLRARLALASARGLVPRNAVRASYAEACRKNRAALYPEHEREPTLQVVSGSTTTPSKQPKAPRVRPDLAARIQQGRFDIQAAARMEFDATDVLSLFIEEAFDEWLANKLAAFRRDSASKKP